VVVVAVALGFALSFAGGSASGVGVSLLLNVFIGLFFYLPIRTIVEEQRDGTVVFVLSLPVRVEEYAIAKVFANLALFLLPAVAVGLASHWAPFGTANEVAPTPEAVVLLRSAWVPVLLTGLLAVFAGVVAIALVTGSMGWTVASVVGTLFVLGNVLPRLMAHWEVGRRWIQAVTNGDPIVAVFILAELGLAAGVLLWAVHRVVRRRQYV
jgi:hypothetical protein